MYENNGRYFIRDTVEIFNVRSFVNNWYIQSAMIFLSFFFQF